ncbi:MAG: oligosaccharide flippase family protein [Deltaproteobacteria bacterium]
MALEAGSRPTPQPSLTERDLVPDLPPSAIPPLVPPDDGPADSSSDRAVRGGAFALSGHMVVQGLRMGGQIVLTRLIPQEAFGLMAIVYTFRGAIDLFSDIGVGPSIIQNARGDDPRFLDTAWTVQFGRGVALWLFTAACALPMAAFYGHPELALLIPIASFSAVVAGSRSTKGYSAERHLDLGRLTLIEVIAQISALSVMVVWAFWSPTVWALVAGGLVGATVDVVLGHLILTGYNGRFGLEKAALRALAQFGKWVFLSTVLTFAVNEADRLVFGKMVTLAELGVYNVALTIASIPLSAMHSLAQKVIFPLFSRVNNTTQLAKVFGQARRLHLVLSGWALSGFIGGGPAAVSLVYDNRYASGGWMLQLLAVGAWISTPEATNSSALLAGGQPRWVAFGNFSKLLGMVALIPLGYAWYGFPGALTAYALSELFRYGASTFGVYRRGLPTLRQDAGFTLVVAAASLCSLFVQHQLQAYGAHVIVQALGVFVVTTLIWIPWLWPYLHDVLKRLERRFAR